MIPRFHVFVVLLCLTQVHAAAEIGDPQLRTDHPWYPGELAMSNFDRLAKTQAEAWRRVTGRPVETDEDRALASWFWRNLHFAHGEEGRGDYFDEGFEHTDWNRDYWNGLFAHGFGLCGTTHSQWTAEMQQLLGHCRSRAVGVTGHNSFEVFLKGGAYGDQGRWALLDHDVSTIVFDRSGTRLVSIDELLADRETLGNPNFVPSRQRGWRISGLHPDDIKAFSSFRVAEYLAGYAGPPPMVHLRSGESFRRYLTPGLEDGDTFVFWGRNYRAGGIPGPERSRSWVNQPGEMFKANRETAYSQGRVRFANAVFSYRPDFASGTYRQGVIDESDHHVTFEFSSPYVIAATPPDDSDWGIYKTGCRNGLVIHANQPIPVQVSTDRGTVWRTTVHKDLTDLVKGHQQYWLRFGVGSHELSKTELQIRTVCQANAATIPRLRDGVTKVTYAASGRALLSAGPNRDQAMAHLADGKLNSSEITLKLQSPRGEKVNGIFAASHNQSGSPPDPNVAFAIDYSVDAGDTWNSVAKDWRVVRRGVEPADFWSQSFTSGSAEFASKEGPVLVRFSNSGGKHYRRVEAHLVYETKDVSAANVTFAWTNGDGADVRIATRNYGGDAATLGDAIWELDAGKDVKTRWVEIVAD